MRSQLSECRYFRGGRYFHDFLTLVKFYRYLPTLMPSHQLSIICKRSRRFLCILIGGSLLSGGRYFQNFTVSRKQRLRGVSDEFDQIILAITEKNRFLCAFSFFSQ